MVLVERESQSIRDLRVPVLRVASTRKALLESARMYRSKIQGRVIAVTGSAGKTTTKHLIHEILSTRLRGSTAPKSFNNDIGVPLTILNAKSDDAYLVLEIGTNAPGEINALAQIASPDVAVITSIGRSHLERLGSIDAVAREKASILQHIRDRGLAVVNDNSMLTPLLPPGLAVVRFGRSNVADLRLTARGSHDGRWWFQLNGAHRFEMGIPGEHNALNASAAIAVARHLGLTDGEITLALSRATLPDMRMMRSSIAGIEFHNDAYNANPESMAASLKTFGELAGNADRRVIMLGDMLELGSHAADAHREVIDRLLELHEAMPVALVVLVGPNLQSAAQEIPATSAGFQLHVHAALDQDRVRDIAGLLRPGDTVLVKGSRGMAMERIIHAASSLHESSARAGHALGARSPSSKPVTTA